MIAEHNDFGWEGWENTVAGFLIRKVGTAEIALWIVCLVSTNQLMCLVGKKHFSWLDLS